MPAYMSNGDYSVYFNIGTMQFWAAPKKVKPSKVISNGPATVVLWDDGTKTVSKCHEGDTPSERIGLLTCCVRKAMRNRRCDHLEYLTKVAANMLRTPEALRAYAKGLRLMADALELEEE